MDYHQRRCFISGQIRERGFVGFDDIAGQFGQEAKDEKTWIESLKSDEKFFRDLHLPYRISGRTFVKDEVERRRRSYEIREGLNVDEKKWLANAASILLAGAADLGPIRKRIERLAERIRIAKIRQSTKGRQKSRSDDDPAGLLEEIRSLANSLLRLSSNANELNSLFERWESFEPTKLLNRVRAARVAASSRDVARLLHDYFGKSHRHVLLDSGTTTKEIALKLKELHFWHGPPYLTVYTNAPRIEEILEESNIGVVGLMGEVRKDTSARTGFWSQRSLDLLREINIDVAVVGTTGLAFDNQHRLIGFACDSFDEASTKSRMLGLASIRAVCADGRKLSQASSSAFVFAEADAAAVDILITDSTAMTGIAAERLLELDRTGIFVLVGDEQSLNVFPTVQPGS